MSESREILGSFISESRRNRIAEVSRARLRLPLILEDIHNMGNISAVCRSAEALGFHELHLITRNLSFKQSSRTTQGADQWLFLKPWQSTRACLLDLRSRGYKIAVSDPEAALALTDLPLDRPLALTFGNEKDGVSEELRQAADLKFRIPMTGFSKSFNISVAAGICLFEIWRRIQVEKPVWAILSREEQSEIEEIYTRRSLPFASKMLSKKGLESAEQSLSSLFARP
ncbi:MAG: RNA methyltransferase [Bradymonadales bacterium]|nr:MAG: RNA methyltransferase [Bradymonadales bacterium]